MKEKINYKYCMSTEQIKLSVYGIPVILFTDDRFKELSLGAKVTYALMLDRTTLALRNNQVDSMNRVYIDFQTDEIMKLLNCGRNKATLVRQELDSETGIGLIERKRQGHGKPDRIFVKIPEEGVLDKEGLLYFSDFRRIGLDEDYNELKKNIEEIRRNIDYESLIIAHKNEKEMIDEMVELILEVVLNKNTEIEISKNKYPAALVKERMLTLGYFDIEYVLLCVGENSTEVKNMKKYLLTTLFNAPVTREIYYKIRVNRDMKRGVLGM